jgi:hypothetical protein
MLVLLLFLVISGFGIGGDFGGENDQDYENENDYSERRATIGSILVARRAGR